jgi:hypothetical protein
MLAGAMHSPGCVHPNLSQLRSRLPRSLRLLTNIDSDTAIGTTQPKMWILSSLARYQLDIAVHLYGPLAVEVSLRPLP